MKALMKLLILASLVCLASCNEKVSPELQNANTSLVDPNDLNGNGIPDVNETVVPTEYFFKIDHGNSPLLGYNVHKTGAGNQTAVCETRKTTPLSNAIYTSGDPDSDITCYFEAEELSLYFSGITFDISASANTCEYVGYSPFSFYHKMPGSTNNANIVNTKCVDTSSADAIAAGAAVGCDQYMDTVVGTPFTVTAETDLCRFNYPADEGGEACDTGTVTVTEETYTTDTATGTTTLTGNTTRTITCGGKVSNCIKGPITLVSSLANKTSGVEITQSANNVAFSKQYTLPGLILDQRYTNQLYTNFRRDLANYDIEYGDRSDPLYSAQFDTITPFDPAVAANYSRNLRPDGITTNVASANVVRNFVTTTPLAAEPFVGLTGATRTSPFYTFYCFDRAFDVKARVRLVVREWDRIYPTTSDGLTYLSDINDGTTARQDNPDGTELANVSDDWNGYNDRYDWDDFIYMSRTPGPVDITAPSTTIYAPMSGFYSTSLFPGNGY